MKRLTLMLPLLLLIGCTEETTIEQNNSTPKQEVVNDEQKEVTPPKEGIVTQPAPITPTEEQEYSEQDEATEPLQYEEPTATTEVGKLYSDMLVNMSAPNLTSYTAQIAVSEKMQWEEMGHPNAQVVTLGATITAKNGATYERLMTGEYIQELNDLRENASVEAYERLDDEYAAYFNEGTQWYRTDPTTLKEQIAVGFYFESIDMLLSHFEASADSLALKEETAEAATFTLTLNEQDIIPVLKKLLQKDDYEVLAPFQKVSNTILLTITKGGKPTLQDISVVLSAETATGTLTHESSMSFTALNKDVTITAPIGIEAAEVFDVQ